LEDRIDLREGSLFDPVGSDERFDVIVSNPPYVAEADEDSLEPEVREWESRGALFGGHDGLDILRRIVAGAGRHLRPGGLLALEVGAGQAGTVAEALRATGGYDDVAILRDYAGKERFVFAHGVHWTDDG
jgi:release factor glutamine methyltransferase